MRRAELMLALSHATDLAIGQPVEYALKACVLGMRLTDVLLARAEELMAGLDAAPSWEAVLALEPEPQAHLSEAELDEACLAMADFADIKSPGFRPRRRTKARA